MKKFLLLCLFALCITGLTGCGNANASLVKNNLSEVTYEYFCGESEGFDVSMSVGRREEPYMLDGRSQNKVDFSLIVFKDRTGLLEKSFLDAIVTVSGKKEMIALQFNPLSNCYMYDLGFKIGGDVEFEFNGQKITLERQKFYINEQKAIEISCQTFENLIENYKKDGKLFAECYLKILGDKSGGLYWCFTIVGQDGKSFNLILSTNDGKVIASDQTF